MCRYDETALPARTSSVPGARRWVADRLAEWDIAERAEDIELVTSELVSNAVLHARTPVDMALSLAEGYLELAVADRDSRAPRPREASGDEPSGRGLTLVETLSDEWGIDQRMNGKTVWFRVAARDGGRYAERCVCDRSLGGLEERRSGSGQRVVVMDESTLPGGDR